MPLPILRPFRVITNLSLATDTYALILEPADNELLFPFVAGQWVMVHLLNDDGTPWGKAAFSLANAPSEADGKLELAIKVYGDFTKRAQGLKPGDIVKIQGPYGVFTLRPGTDPLILFSAGIGVTPFRSMIREILATGDTRPVTLFYTNRTRQATAYETELRELAASHPSFKNVFILTGADVPSDWDGERGRLNEEMLVRHVGTFDGKEYAMCGPRGFMDMIKEALAKHGVDVKVKVRKELFS